MYHKIELQNRIYGGTLKILLHKICFVKINLIASGLVIIHLKMQHNTEIALCHTYNVQKSV